MTLENSLANRGVLFSRWTIFCREFSPLLMAVFARVWCGLLFSVQYLHYLPVRVWFFPPIFCVIFLRSTPFESCGKLRLPWRAQEKQRAGRCELVVLREPFLGARGGWKQQKKRPPALGLTGFGVEFSLECERLSKLRFARLSRRLRWSYHSANQTSTCAFSLKFLGGLFKPSFSVIFTATIPFAFCTHHTRTRMHLLVRLVYIPLR